MTDLERRSNIEAGPEDGFYPKDVVVEMVREGYLSGWKDRAECAQQDVGVPSFAGVMNQAQAAADKITMK